MNYLLELEAKNKSEAQKSAAELLGASDDLFEVENESSGLLGLVSRKPTTFRIKAKEGLSDEAKIRGVVLTLIDKMGIDAEAVGFEQNDENYIIQLESEDSGVLIGRQGRTLDAIQFIVNLLVNSDLQDKRRVLVDVAEYRERRKKKLHRIAKSVAEKVGKTGRSVLLESMNPYERRILHLALEEDSRVTTRSEGNGLYKRVRVVAIRNESADEYDDVDGNVYDDESEDEPNYNR